MTVKTDRARVLEFAAFFQVLRPDEEAVTLWINTMASGDYRFGFGLLRSADDDYDPLGVLAALQGVDWTWDEQDEAWAYKGSATTLNPFEFGKWLGIKAGDYDWLSRFVESLAQLADQSPSFAAVCACLQEAQTHAQHARERLMGASQAAHNIRGPDSMERVESLDRRRYDRTPFYAPAGSW